MKKKINFSLTQQIFKNKREIMKGKFKLSNNFLTKIENLIYALEIPKFYYFCI